MAIEDINLGTGPNTKTGDPLRTAMAKVNANFQEVEDRLERVDTHYHEQQVSAALWDIVHNLGRYPSVTVVDTAGSQVYGDVTYLSENRIRVSFSAPFAGVAYLN